MVRWWRLDLDAIFYEDEELTPPIPPAKPPLLEIPEEKKDKIKAFVLVELKEDKEL